MRLVWGAIPAILAAGVACAASASDPARGEKAYHKCIACHALEPNRNSPAGPTLHAIVGRPIAAEPGFNYSPALRGLAASHGRWTPDRLDRFLEDPEAMVPGTEMGFPGMTDPDERHALIDWLAGLPRNSR